MLCSVGMADHTIPPEGTITLYERRKAESEAPTRIAKFMEVGHLPMLEETAEFASELTKHFEFAEQFYKSKP